MFSDIQVASMTKRISAFLLDIIAFGVIVTGVSYLISFACNYDAANDRFQQVQQEFAEEYGVSFDMTQEEYQAMSEEERAEYDLKMQRADEALRTNEEVKGALAKVVWLSILILFVSFALGFVVVEIIVPIILKNGQTIGKKVFGLAVMHTNGLRITGFGLFARAMLGKCALETMIPAAILLMLFWGFLGGIPAIGALVTLLVIQCILCFSDPDRRILHDRLSSTVVVDNNSQKMFDTLEERERYIASHRQADTNSIY